MAEPEVCSEDHYNYQCLEVQAWVCEDGGKVPGAEGMPLRKTAAERSSVASYLGQVVGTV